MRLKLKKSDAPLQIRFRCHYCGCWDLVNRSQLNHYKGAGTFCSRQCAFSYYREHPEERQNYNNGRTIDGNGYVLMRDPRIPKNEPVIRVREHRLIMEQHLGRRLDGWEHIHHKNGNKIDNRIENLVIMDEASHHLLHSDDSPMWGKPAGWLEWDFSVEPETWINPKEIILDPFIELDIVDLYLDGLGMARIGKLYGHSRELVKRVLRDYGIPFRKWGRHRGTWSEEAYEALRLRAQEVKK